MKIDLIGYTGKTGSIIYEYLKNTFNFHNLVNSKNYLEYLESKPKGDIIIDFSSKNFLLTLISKDNIKGKIFYIIGTTGFTQEEFEEIDNAFKRMDIIALHFPNFSLGINLMNHFVKIVSLFFDEVEIIELHHKTKKDKPSGTSLMTTSIISKNLEQRGIKKEINIHSLRLPSLVAHQSVIFSNDVGEVLEITHHSLNRLSFALGVKKVLEKIVNEADNIKNHPGLHKNLNILEFLGYM